MQQSSILTCTPQRPGYGCLYVMYSKQHGISKVGFSGAPRSRLCQVRKERYDMSIDLVAFWVIMDFGDEDGPMAVEQLFHIFLSKLNVSHPKQLGFGEWYGIYWPNLVAYIESIAAMLAPLDILIRRGRMVREM